MREQVGFPDFSIPVDIQYFLFLDFFFWFFSFFPPSL